MKRRYSPLARTYLAAWDDDLIVKAGFTLHPHRYRAFEIRGARIVSVAALRRGAVDLEVRLERTLGALSEGLAFRDKRDAIGHLGGHGGGYLECHRFASRAEMDNALRICRRIMREHLQGAHSFGSCTDGRTDGLTETPTQDGDIPLVSDARDSSTK